MTKAKKSVPAIEIAKTLAEGSGGVIALTTGYHAKIRPVSASLIDDAQALVKEPQPPEVYIEEKDRFEKNPSDPVYLRAIERADIDKVMSALDTIILLGVELVNEDGTAFKIERGPWLNKLQLLSKLGRIDLSPFELDDPIDLEFVFKKYIAISAGDIATVSGAAGITGESVAIAEASFPGTAE